MGNMVWKVLGTGSAIVAGIVANKIVSTAIVHLPTPTGCWPSPISRMAPMTWRSRT